MNELKQFEKYGHELINWLSTYFEDVEKYPVRANTKPGDIRKMLPKKAPKDSVELSLLIDQFKTDLLKGITHWQHPNFHAFFPANNSAPSVLAELLMSGLGVQGMKWVTSPVATELEQVVMKWLQQMLSLPDSFSGVIMDTASVATLCAVLAAREKVSSYEINEKGFGKRQLRVYCSKEAHSSVEKAVRIAGIGSENLVKIEVDNSFKISVDELEHCIEEDISQGYTPTCIVAALGTTGSGAIDDIDSITKLSQKYNVWLHVDAAYLGTALILPEVRESIKGLEKVDSFVFNPHKWMFTNFDCSAFFVKEKKWLTDTFSLVPPYLRTDATDDELDYSNWGIQLGRRFRALKLWFVINFYGISGLQDKIREHISFGEQFEKLVKKNPNFELVVPRSFNIICFRFIHEGNQNRDKLNQLNKNLIESINNSGDIYLSHTFIDQKYVIRFVCGQTNLAQRHIEKAWKVILRESEKITKEI